MRQQIPQESCHAHYFQWHNFQQELEVVRRHFGGRVHEPRSVYKVTAESTELADQVEQLTLSEQGQVAVDEESKEETSMMNTPAEAAVSEKKKKSKSKAKRTA